MNIMAGIGLLGFDHIDFTVKDLDEAIAFYGKLGFTLVRRLDHGGESAQMLIGSEGVIVDLHLARSTQNPGYNHIAVSVEDLDYAVEELRSHGIDVDGPVIVQATGRKLATIRDPSGFLIQLVESEK